MKSEERVNLPPHIRQTVGKFLQSIAVSTIKHDEHGSSFCAKYRIVTLGNYDPYAWTKQEYYIPLLYLFKTNLIVVMEAQHNCIPQTRTLL